MRTRVVALVGVTCGIAAITVLIVLIRSVTLIPNLAVLYLLPVMFCAVTWGWWSALAAAVLAFLTYNFSFTKPVHTFAIHEPHEWVALLIFLAVAAVTSNLAARERARREEAHRQARTATLLYDVSRALSGNGLEPGLRAIGERLVSEFGLDGVAIALDEVAGRAQPYIVVGDAGPALALQPAGRVFSPTEEIGRLGRWVTIRSGGGATRSISHRQSPVAILPLRRDGRPWGTLRLVGRRDEFAADETQLLATIADRLALALEREALRNEAYQAEVLRRTDELRTALVNTVSHDLRTPLAAIKASAESLLQRDVAWSDDDRVEFAAAINREADRLNRLVGNLLDLSRIEGGALRLQREWYDVGELVREVIARLRPSLNGHPVSLRIPDGLPPASLDYLMIDQVMTNLVENVVKYTPPGSPIIVSIERADGCVRVAVEDRGPGIPREERERIFDKFYRLETKAGTRGSGLGLAVSRGLVAAHGGRIWADGGSGPPAAPGARFVFELPCEEAGTPPSPTSPSAPRVGVEGDGRTAVSDAR